MSASDVRVSCVAYEAWAASRTRARESGNSTGDARGRSDDALCRRLRRRSPYTAQQQSHPPPPPPTSSWAALQTAVPVVLRRCPLACDDLLPAMSRVLAADPYARITILPLNLSPISHQYLFDSDILFLSVSLSPLNTPVLWL